MMVIQSIGGIVLVALYVMAWVMAVLLVLELAPRRRPGPMPPKPHDADDRKNTRQAFTAEDDVNGEGARPSSLIPYYHHKPDPDYLLQLKYAVEIANEETVRKYGPLRPGGLPVRKKAEPDVSYGDFRGNVVRKISIVEEEDEMKLREMAAAAVLAAGTAACTPTTPAAAPTDTRAADKAATDSAAIAEHRDAKPKHVPSPLRSLLNAFASPEGTTWSSFDTVVGVQWDDQKITRNLEARSDERLYQRRGKLLLTGFGSVDMPNGKVGIDFGLVKKNEGNVGVTLNGYADHVHSISLVKFYPSENYQDIIQQQLQSADTVTPIADRCMLNEYGDSDNASKYKFYEIRVSGSLVYAEASVIEDDASTASASSLGSTLFDFYRDKPAQKIEKMRCREP